MIVCRVVNTLEYVERRDVKIDNSLPKDTTRSTLLDRGRSTSLAAVHRCFIANSQFTLYLFNKQ